LNEHWFLNIDNARRSGACSLRQNTSAQRHFRIVGEKGYGKDGRDAALEKPSGSPLSDSQDDGKSSLSDRA
jgi:hypothetical protein